MITLWLVGLCVPLCIPLIILWVRRNYAVACIRGQSMVPAYYPGDRVLVRRMAGKHHRVGDVAVLRPPVAGARRPELAGGMRSLRRSHWIIKRVAALPGDPVPLGVRPAVGDTDIVPEGMLVLLGDNPGRSTDSRSWGFVPTKDLIGKIVSRYPVRVN